MAAQNNKADDAAKQGENITQEQGETGAPAEQQGTQDPAAAEGTKEEKKLTPAVDAAINAEVVRAERQAVQQQRAQKKMRITIASGRDSSERSPVEVGVNGQHYLIERDKEVSVPEAVVNVLQLAKENVPTLDDMGRITSFVPTMRYPLTIHGDA